ncbi:MAG TPA: hypothetical protein VII95_06095 [Terriglobales bacterium]|jgi:hypothetical protein
MNRELAISAVMLFAAVTTSTAQQPAASTEGTPLHTRTEFSFTVDAPFDQVAPLFGADEERKWAAGWNPQFIYPTPARDQQGMVFKVAHGQFTSAWVNTALDLAVGHIQYAYVLNDAMAVLIDIHLTRQSAQKTGVTVVYERTALLPEANEHVQHFTKSDAGAGKEWGDAINSYFAKARVTGQQK